MAALIRMADFAEQFLEIGTSAKKDIWLVNALLEIIDNDRDITELIYCPEIGKTIAKAEISKQDEICLPAFLLGVWHFIIANRRDNKPGNVELNIETIGNGIAQKIKVTMPKNDAPCKNAARADEPKKKTEEQPADIPVTEQSTETPEDIADPKRITVNNYGTVQNQKFISIETMNGDIHL